MKTNSVMAEASSATFRFINHNEVVKGALVACRILQQPNMKDTVKLKRPIKRIAI